MSYQFKNISVLIVESSRALLGVTKGVLETFGIVRVYPAYGAEEGYKKFCEIKPDLVIIDWMDDPMNGIALTKQIRSAQDSVNPYVPIIMMTGYSQKRRVLMARDSGITEFLVKPYTAKALYQKIEQIIEFPRVFVKSEGYVGPDRRRRRENTGYNGSERRQDQPSIIDLKE